MGYLQNITRLKSEDNTAGIVSLQVARKSDFESIPDPVSGTIYNDIVFKAGRTWVIWDVILETPRAKGQDNVTREGPSKKNSLEFTIPKDRDTIRQQLDLAHEDELIVLFKDSNGKQKIFGTLTAPARFEYSHDSGAQFSNLNGYSCRFYFDGPDNIYFYNGVLSAPAAGLAPAVVYFNGAAIASLAPGEELHISSDYSLSDFFTVT